MKIETDNLIRVNTVVKEKDITAKYAYTLIEKGTFEGIRIDGIQFVIRDEKYEQYRKKGRRKENQ